ncbi:MAG: deoxyribose-phosphate aldolase [Treponema sp.]|jgi:deoxyribose-phosphate aldolase|nr:deoxyribose-phosphate aldolase [Treponema sp.]
MTDAEILKHIDLTLLKAASSWAEVRKLCDEGIRFKTASVCIPPSYVKPVFETYGEKIPVCTVLGFPLGYSLGSAKVLEAEEALKAGAEELDMVINIGDVKNGYFDKVFSEIKAIKKTAGDKILKVIVETCYLTREEKIRMCEIVTGAGAGYIKTSTGLGPAGATLEDILLFKEHIGPGVKIKAAGGVRTREDMAAYLEAGCDRIGTSSISVLTNSLLKTAN